jgi:hypothetical protein
MIDTITSKLNNTVITTLPAYLNYSVTYSDGGPIKSNQELNAGTKETIKIRVEYKKDLTASDLPTTEQTLNFSFTTIYIQKDDTSIPVTHPESFATDSWETIIGAVKSGNTSAYNVGDTKTVSLGSLGTHTLRIANKSTPAECNQEGFSQTACGFVLEFADIITTHNMNNSNTCTGGWPATSMRTYLNDTNSSTSVINLIPEVLRNAIIDTIVISSHGSSSTENNFTSTDKLYLLGAHEIWEDVDGNTNSGLDYNDTAYNNTRQLDYYSQSNVTTSTPSYSGAVKKRNGTVSIWYTRSPIISNPNGFRVVSANGNWSSAANASGNSGVSPAFRIG